MHCPSLLTCALVLLGVLVNTLHLLNLYLHSFFEILDHLHYQYSKFFFSGKFAYLYFIWLYLWGFVLFLHLGQKPSAFFILFNFSVMCFWF